MLFKGRGEKRCYVKDGEKALQHTEGGAKTKVGRKEVKKAIVVIVKS